MAQTQEQLADARDGMAGRVAVVMTMGALHAGHVRLIRTAHELADTVLVTIFVNPLQFGAGEDLDRYPRSLETDLETCAVELVDVVFAPEVEVVYPPGEQVAHQHSGALGDQLEGASRPGHFDGVLTVVARLLELTRADVALFGEKDAQQLELIRRMVADQPCLVEIVGVPTVREPDGLALSSRNRYLDATERADALALSKALACGAAAAKDGVAAVRAAAQTVLAGAPGVAVDYVTVVDDESWGPADENTRRARILVAARVGPTRLIDNVVLDLGTSGTAAG
ncbi:MAG TPA: pantoate--beta-alanine ligase [Mycobacteriales bacterium]|nr:pantoate--beta-alanine ligase [Mycobacteriales bacterium]